MKQNMINSLREHFNNFAYLPEKSFLLQLMTENKWTESYARRSIAEYIKFIALIMEDEIQVSPSKTIDLVWHTHLIYTRNYLQMCKIKSDDYFIHHDPSSTVKEDEGYNLQYKKTLEAYMAKYNKPAPEDIW